jgi:hypothetical protein
MSIQYRLVQSGKTASGGCSAGQGSSEPVAPRIIFTETNTSRLATGMKENGEGMDCSSMLLQHVGSWTTHNLCCTADEVLLKH